MNATLIVGFDSAWTARRSGSIVGALLSDGKLCDLGAPKSVTFAEAADTIHSWQQHHRPRSTLVMLDQPTIVNNAHGQRPVENIVSSPVSRRRGGVQPANLGRLAMFGPDAPVWSFLADFPCASLPLEDRGGTQVLETYPVLALIAFDWLVHGDRPSGRLPKYNPERRGTFSLDEWAYVCRRTAAALEGFDLTGLARGLEEASRIPRPRKRDQDHVDACICLLVGVHLALGREMLVVGDHTSGYMVVPHGAQLATELRARCLEVPPNPGKRVDTARFARL